MEENEVICQPVLDDFGICCPEITMRYVQSGANICYIDALSAVFYYSLDRL